MFRTFLKRAVQAEAIGSVKEARSIFRNQGAKEWEVTCPPQGRRRKPLNAGTLLLRPLPFTQAKALLTLAGINLEKDSDLGAVETALKNATEARLASHVYG